MASDPTLDLERLTSPISEDQPSGNYLRETDYERFQRAKDLRTIAVSAERKLLSLSTYSEEDLAELPEQDRDAPRPQWGPVLDSCVEILAEHSKDLWVATWLVESSTRESGFAGLRDAFGVVSELVEKYWESINPPPDEEEGYLGTISQLTSLNGEDGPGILILPIESLALLPDEPEVNLLTYRQATVGSGGKFTEAELFAAARQCDPDQLRDHGEDIEQTIANFEQLDQILIAKCGTEIAPPTSQIRRALEECQHTFQILTRDVMSDEPSEDSDDLTTVDGAVTTGGEAAKVDPAKAQVNNREDAFRLLLRASEFFRKTEPHSPVSYMLQQAVRFGRMELPDLLQELIADETVLKQFAERTGIQLKDTSEGDGY